MKRVPYPNGKELLTVKYSGDTCVIYKEEYAYGDSLALFMYDLTTDELWGDITINLPGYSSGSETVYLQDFIDSKILDILAPLLKYQGRVKYNMGTYAYADVDQKLLPLIPTWEELCEMLGNTENTAIDASTDISEEGSVIEYRDWAIYYNRDGNGKYSVWDFDGVEEFVEDFDTLEDAQIYVDSLIDYYAAVAEREAEERRELQEELKWWQEIEKSENNTSINAYTNVYHKDANGNAPVWNETPHKILIDGEYGTYTDYSRDLGNGYQVYIVPKYIAKSDMLVYQVSVISPDIDLDKIEAFETFYDAMDFVDSGELAHRMGW